MASKRFQITWKTVLLPALGLLAFFLYLYLFNVDVPKIIATAQRINLTIYSLAIVAVIFETFFFALSWHSLLNFLSVKLSVMKSFLYVWFGIFMDTLIPAESISGEISRIYLVTREQNGTSGKVVASLVAHRLMGMGINIVSLLVGTVVLLMGKQFNGIVLNVTLFLIAATTIFLILLILLSVKERWTLKIIDVAIRFVEYVGRGRWKLLNIREEVVKAAKMFHNSMKEFGRAPKTLFTSLFFHVLSWLFSIGVSYLVFLSIGPPIHWSVIILTCSIVATVKAIPLGVPFEAGLPEITMSTLYIVLGVQPDISATTTILIRISTVWLRFFIGFAVQQWLGIKAITDANNKIAMPKIEKT
ncbi:MAG: lysylphosphatidylglycerol synthase transmembrane domain-containing protein [Candidatus Bathyarchaeia archaeon]|nr:lysylphosphatidylglycerol synthase transmembrane domain-containing protein [Candidatus Bathyarchaeia archaeon]